MAVAAVSNRHAQYLNHVLSMNLPLRNCLFEPIPQLFEAAALLHNAAIAHAAEDTASARTLIAQTDANPSDVHSPIFDWSETLFKGKILSLGKTVCPELRANIFERVVDPDRPTGYVANSERIPAKLATEVIARDGYFCRYCGIPVIDPKAQSVLRKAYPDEYRWWSKKGEFKSRPKNIERHVAFQALDLDWEHIVPRSLGGMNTLSNLVVACSPCNTGKENHTLVEMRLNDPRERPPTVPIGFENWDGLTCVL